MKNKILKRIPFLISALCLATSLQGASYLLSMAQEPAPGQSAEVLPVEPQILGAVDSLRGTEPEKRELAQINPVDLSEISAKTLVVFNANGGENLIEKKPDLQLGIASLTKLMTAFAAY